VTDTPSASMSNIDPDETTDMPAKPEKRAIGLIVAGLAVVALAFACFSSSWLYAERTQLQLHEDNKLPLTIGPVHEAAFGLRGFEMCITRDGATTCDSMSNSELLEKWRREVLAARFVAQEPVLDEVRAAFDEKRYLELVAQRTLAAGSTDSTTNELLAMAQRDLLIAKRVYATSSVFPVLGWITFVACLIALLSLAAATAIVIAKKRVRLPVMPTTTALLGVLVALGTGCVYVAVKPGPPGYVGVGVGFFVFGIGVVLGLYSSLVLNKLMRPHDPDLLEDAMKADEF
jgi:hypothetical protein